MNLENFSVILGTTSGQLIVMDHHGNTTEIYSLSTQSIRQLIYSCEKFYPEAPDTSNQSIEFFFISIIIFFDYCRCYKICQ